MVSNIVSSYHAVRNKGISGGGGTYNFPCTSQDDLLGIRMDKIFPVADRALKRRELSIKK